MGLWIDVVRVAASLNVVLLAVLCAVWARNYLEFRSKHTLGLLIFGIALLAENALAVHYFMLDPALSVWFDGHMSTPAGDAMMTLRVFETAAVVFLVWVTWD